MAEGISAENLCVATVPLFAGLTDEQLFIVAERAVPIRKRQGERIHSPGDPLSHLFVVHRGRVRVAHNNVSGVERLIRVLEPGDFIGEAAFVTGARAEHEITALTDVELCSFDHRAFQDLVDEYPLITQQMLRTLSGRLEQAERFIAEVTTSPVAARVANYVSDLPAFRGDDGVPTITLPLAKRDIASLLGITPETLSRQLSEMERLGIISNEDHVIRVTDEQALVERAISR